MSTSRSSWWPSLAAILAYAVAILSVTTAMVTGLLLDQFLQTTPYVSLFLCSIMFAAWFGGLGPSLLATAIAVLLFTYYFVDPGGSFEVAAKDVPRVALFTITALFVVSLSAAQRRNADSLRFARDELQATVQELARVNKALEAENARRRRVEAYLDEAQGLSRTGSFSWKVSSGDIFWSKEGYRMLELDRAAKPSIDLFLQGVHPDDRQVVQHEIDRAQAGRTGLRLRVSLADAERPDEASSCPRPPRSVRLGRRRDRRRADRRLRSPPGAGGAACGANRACPRRACRHARRDERLDRPRGEPAARRHRHQRRGRPALARPQGAGARRGSQRDGAHDPRRQARQPGGRTAARARPEGAGADDASRPERGHHRGRGPAPARDPEPPHRPAARPRARSAAGAGRPRRVAAGRHQPDDERHAGDGPRNRPAAASRGPFFAAQTTRCSSRCGIPASASIPTTSDRLFNAFFTTRANGMGMGLSIGRSIVESYGGRIWASNNDGPGTTFQFALPLRAEGAS